MARTAIVPNDITTSGVAPTQTTGIADGHEFLNNGKVVARVTNADASARTVTFVTGGSSKGEGGSEPIADRTVSVPATATRYIGPFEPAIFNDPTNKLVDIDYEAGEYDHFTVELIRYP